MLYTGLDIHKKSIYGTMMDEDGRPSISEEFVPELILRVTTIKKLKIS